VGGSQRLFLRFEAGARDGRVAVGTNWHSSPCRPFTPCWPFTSCAVQERLYAGGGDFQRPSIAT
jgi:hypothetical protein